MQSASHVILVRPRHFGFNPETAADNVFQKKSHVAAEEIAQQARIEFDGVVKRLTEIGVACDVFEDSDEPLKADAVFPNNWLSTHADGTVITYPMMSSMRRNERRTDIIDALREKYRVRKYYSFEQYEQSGQFLEGTGSMVIDRMNKRVYASLGIRTDICVLDKFCVLQELEKIVFHSEMFGQPIYHTNVMMSIGTKFAVMCADCIADENERRLVERSLELTGRDIVLLTTDQVASFAGNCLELHTAQGAHICAMSTQAYRSLNNQQLAQIAKHAEIVPIEIDHIEKYSGGSVRCMIAENFLEPQ